MSFNVKEFVERVAESTLGTIIGKVSAGGRKCDDDDEVRIMCRKGDIKFKLKCTKLDGDSSKIGKLGNEVRYQCHVIPQPGQKIDRSVLESSDLKCSLITPNMTCSPQNVEHDPNGPKNPGYDFGSHYHDGPKEDDDRYDPRGPEYGCHGRHGQETGGYGRYSGHDNSDSYGRHGKHNGGNHGSYEGFTPQNDSQDDQDCHIPCQKDNAPQGCQRNEDKPKGPGGLFVCNWICENHLRNLKIAQDMREKHKCGATCEKDGKCDQKSHLPCDGHGPCPVCTLNYCSHKEDDTEETGPCNAPLD